MWGVLKPFEGLKDVECAQIAHDPPFKFSGATWHLPPPASAINISGNRTLNGKSSRLAIQKGLG